MLVVHEGLLADNLHNEDLEAPLLVLGFNSKDDGAVAYDVVWSDAPTSSSRFTLYYLYINLNGCERSTGRPRVNSEMIWDGFIIYISDSVRRCFTVVWSLI